MKVAPFCLNDKEQLMELLLSQVLLDDMGLNA